MIITYDINKSKRNINERGLSFECVAEFDFETALYAVDDRYEYGETRIVAIGYRKNRLHVLCFVETENGIRVISFRKANPREINHYAAQ